MINNLEEIGLTIVLITLFVPGMLVIFAAVLAAPSMFWAAGVGTLGISLATVAVLCLAEIWRG